MLLWGEAKLQDCTSWEPRAFAAPRTPEMSTGPIGPDSVHSVSSKIYKGPIQGSLRLPCTRGRPSPEAPAWKRSLTAPPKTSAAALTFPWQPWHRHSTAQAYATSESFLSGTSPNPESMACSIHWTAVFMSATCETCLRLKTPNRNVNS